MPDRASGLTAGVDIQETWIEVTVVAWGRGNESWVVHHERITGDFDRLDTQQLLDDVLFKTYAGKNGRPFRIERTYVDSGYKTTSVYRYAKARLDHKIFPSKGLNETGKNPKPVHPANPSFGGTMKVPVYLIGTINAKADFYSFLSRSTPGPGFVHLSKDACDHDFLRGLLAERRVKVPGGFKFECKEGARNEPLDTWCLAYAAAEGVRQEHKDVLVFDRWADEIGVGREMTEIEAARFNVDSRKEIARATREAMAKTQRRKAAPLPAQVVVDDPAFAKPEPASVTSPASERPVDRSQGPSLPSRFPQIARRSGNRGYGSPF